MQHVSSSLSKIPYVGFSPVRLQTGSPRRPSSCSARSYLYAVPVRPSDPIAIAGILSGSSVVTAPPVQRSLARQRVLLSHRVIAYYGLIRDSNLLPLIYYLIQRVSVAQLLPTGRPEVPQFTLRVFTHLPHSVPRQTVRLLLTVTSSHILASAIFVLARHLLYPQNPVHCGLLTRLQVSLYATACWVCSPYPARTFTFELHLRWSPTGNVEYNYMGIQSIPMTGLSPARHAALWAANEITRTSTKK